MAASLLPRVPANTLYGHHAAVFSADGADLIGTFMNVGYGTERATADGRTVLEGSSYAVADKASATLDFSRVVESTLGLMAIAASADPVLTVVLRHCITGDYITGSFIITNARWSCSAGQMQAEGITAVNQGEVTSASNTAKSAAPAPVVAPANRLTGINLSKLIIGATYDFVAVYTEMTVEMAIDTADGSAAKDSWTYARPIARRTTISASRVVQADTGVDSVPAAALHFDNLLRAGAAVDISIENGDTGTTTIAGSGIVTSARLEMGDGPQKESITVDGRGAFTVS